MPQQLQDEAQPAQGAMDQGLQEDRWQGAGAGMPLARWLLRSRKASAPTRFTTEQLDDC